MKPEELFVGALVRVNHDGLCIKKDTIVEVRAVDADDKLIERGLVGVAHCRPLDDNQFEGGIWCEYFDPIPLTPEILVKNGFKYTNNHTLKGADTYVLRLDQRGFYFTITIKLNDYFAIDSYDDREYRLVQIETGRWSVHHLQHALRLCGIDKTIEL